MRDDAIPRLGTGVHTGGAGGYGSRSKGRGEREPMRWEVLFPKGRTGVLRLCGVGAALVAVAGGIVLWAVLWGGPSGGPSGGPDDGEPPLNGGIPVESVSDGETTAEEWDTPPFDEETRHNHETQEEPSTEPSAEPPAEGSTPEDTEPETPPVGGDGDGSASEEDDSEPDGETVTTAEPTEETTVPIEDESDTVAEDGEETTRPVPEGCYPIVPVDVSESQCGSGYLVGETANLPSALPRDDLWTGETLPTVLLIHTHPFEGFGDGKAWYDPASGGLAQTDSVYAPDGVVALGAALARSLRENGVTVMHLRIAVTAEDTAAEIYERTRNAVNSYLTLYPDIGLILDLRRSAELTEDGSILRTMGELDGEICGQVRISVSGDRPAALLGRDLTAALALREALWQTSPTISRPVWIKSGSGIAGDREGVCALSLELGSAGNTYAEAARLTAPLAEAVNRLIGNGDMPEK